MPFGQLDAARGKGGSGLGLAIAERFADASGGMLELDAAPGGGLLARLVLPRPGA
jgi:signal transduction histidine kinase